MSNRRTARIAAILRVPIIRILCLASVLGCAAPDAAANTPASATGWGIPLQNGFPPGAASAANIAAETLWRDALDAQQSGAGPGAIIPKLAAIWSTWPDSVQAYQARLFALEDLDGEFLSPPDQTTSADFVADAKRWPAIYLSESHHLATLRVADRAVRLAEARNQTTDAWAMCLALRWIVPRLGPLAETCGKVATRHPTLLGTAEQTLRQLAPSVRLGQLNTAAPASADLAKAVDNYLRQPYDSTALEAVVMLLDRAERRDLTVPLIEELLQFDPTITWDRKSGHLKPYAH